MIKGIPTNKGIDILNSELRNQVQTYALVGKQTPKDTALERMLLQEDLSFDEVEGLIFHSASIDVGYFDENRILTYEINLRDINTDKYMYGILLLDTQKQVIASLPTPQVILTDGIGGLITIKLPIKGEISKVVFVSSDYVSRDEFNVLKASLKPPKVDIPALIEQITPLIQEKKDFLHRAHTIADSMLNSMKFLLLAIKEHQRERERIGEYRLFFRNSLPRGYKPRAGFYTKGTDDIAQVGAFKKEGLPDVNAGSWTRSLSVIPLYGKGGGSHDDWGRHANYENFNLARFSSLYGRYESVEVNHTLLLEGIYVGIDS